MTARDKLIEAMGRGIAAIDGLGEEYDSDAPHVRALYARMATAALSELEARACVVPKEATELMAAEGAAGRDAAGANAALFRAIAPPRLTHGDSKSVAT